MLLSSQLLASSEIVEFSDESLRGRYQQLIQELRCPKCQNQNLADSNAPISQDLRAQVQGLLEEGMSDRQIKDYLKARYSDFILYRPEVNKPLGCCGLPLYCLCLSVLEWSIACIDKRTQQTALSLPAQRH